MKSDEHWIHATVEAAEDLSPTVRSLRLRPAGGVRPWTVGSHLRVQVDLGSHASQGSPSSQISHIRHYSLVGLPQHSREEGCYDIAVKRADPGRGGSRFMASLKVGDTLAIAGPDNHFELPASAPHTLLIAGGIGITPMLGMALTLAARGAPLRMAYAARDDSELVFAQALRGALGDRLQTFCDARGERIALDAEIAALPPRAQLLICGPVPLLQATQAAWARAGRPPADLRFETFGSSGNRPVEPFWLRVPRHDLQVQVPADRSLLEVLAEHGVETLYDCQRGECGLCAIDIVELHGEIDHRDVFFSAAEKRENRRLCACVSRVCDGHGSGAIVIDSAWRPDTLSHAAAA
jgi:vanillate O-demethylase ferredoxin subunit